MNHMRAKGHIFLFSIMTIAFIGSAIAQPHFPTNIVIVKDSQTQLTHSVSIEQLLQSKAVDLKVCDIDAVGQFEADISKLLPGDELKARQVLEEYINRTGRDAFEQEAIRAYQGIMAVVRYELEKYPAIVFDDESVIYGVTDLDEALNRYGAWKAGQVERQ
jgi:integrating conjugative element protein (TIGR03757 family)